MVVYLGETDGLPVRVEAVKPTGEIVLAADLGRYTSVPSRHASPAAYPRMPTLIDIADPLGRMKMKLALDEPDGLANDQPWARVFDLDRLIPALRPDRIEEEPDE